MLNGWIERCQQKCQAFTPARLVDLFVLAVMIFLKEKICFLCAGYLFGYPLVMYLSYPTKAGFSITTVDASGQGFFS